MKLLAGNSNRALAEDMGRFLKLPLVKAVVRRFADMEVFVEIQENVRGEDIFVIQSTSFPANDNLMELLIVIDALRRASARRITAVIPYFGYARQDRKVGPRTPISAKLVANLITHAGADRVLTVDLHAGQSPGLLRYPHRQSLRHAGDREGHHRLSGPEQSDGRVARRRRRGACARARQAAGRRSRHRRQARERAGESEVMNIIGDVEGRSCILIDDIVDSGGTICNAAEALLREGAKDVCAYATHGVLSGGAVARIKGSKLKSLVITDSIAATDEVAKCSNIRRISIAPLIGEAMRRINNEESVSSLFD